MAALATQQVTQAGTAVTMAAATSGGDTLTPSDHTHLRVKNGGGSPINVTVAGQGVCNQGFTHDLVVAVAAGAEEDIGPIGPARFARSSDGQAAVTYSGVTSVTVAAVSA